MRIEADHSSSIKHYAAQVRAGFDSSCASATKRPGDGEFESTCNMWLSVMLITSVNSHKKDGPP